MTRLSTAFLGIAVACALAVPATPARAATPPHDVLVAKTTKKKPKKKVAPKKGETPAIAKGMKVVALADAEILDDPSDGGTKVFKAKEGQVLTVVKVQKKWVRVKDEDGKQGWVQAAAVVPKEVYDAQADESGGGDEDEKSKDKDSGKDKDGGKDKDKDEGPAERDRQEDASSGDEDRGKKKKKHADDEDAGGGDESGGATELKGRARYNGKLRIAVGAHVIGLIRNQDFASKGTNAFANYTIHVSSPGAEGVARLTRKGGSLELGAEVGFLATFGNSGITVGSGATAETLTWAETQLDARALIGYHIATGVLVSARVGYRYMTTNIRDSQTIKQPSETLAGVAVGAEAVLYGLSPRLELRVGAETLVAAKLTQTAGREDGTSSAVSPVYLIAEAAYLVTPKLQIVGAYNLGYESYTFTGPSARDPANSNGTRKDLQHTFSIGAQLWF